MVQDHCPSIPGLPRAIEVSARNNGRLDGAQIRLEATASPRACGGRTWWQVSDVTPQLGGSYAEELA
jgi:hypothetical protein